MPMLQGLGFRVGFQLARVGLGFGVLRLSRAPGVFVVFYCYRSRGPMSMTMLSCFVWKVLGGVISLGLPQSGS